MEMRNLSCFCFYLRVERLPDRLQIRKAEKVRCSCSYGYNFCRTTCLSFIPSQWQSRKSCPIANAQSYARYTLNKVLEYSNLPRHTFQRTTSFDILNCVCWVWFQFEKHQDSLDLKSTHFKYWNMWIVKIPSVTLPNPTSLLCAVVQYIKFTLDGTILFCKILIV